MGCQIMQWLACQLDVPTKIKGCLQKLTTHAKLGIELQI
jgi:hypothetical protein